MSVLFRVSQHYIAIVSIFTSRDIGSNHWPPIYLLITLLSTADKRQPHNGTWSASWNGTWSSTLLPNQFLRHMHERTGHHVCRMQ
jgi:hypothetical protein